MTSVNGSGAPTRQALLDSSLCKVEDLKLEAERLPAAEIRAFREGVRRSAKAVPSACLGAEKMGKGASKFML